MTQMRVEHGLLRIKLGDRRFPDRFVGAIAGAILAGVALGRFLLLHQ